MKALVCGALCAGLVGTAQAQGVSDDVVKIGVLTDLSSLYMDNAGPGSVAAAQMAIDDFGGRVLGKKIELVSGDNLNKPDVGASIAREWIDRQAVDAIVDVPNSAVAFAVNELTRSKNRVFLATGTASSRLTGDACSPTTVHWTYDTYALAKGTGQAVVQNGGDSWFFIAADFAVGAALMADTERVIKANGGRVLGAVRHPINSADFSSYILQAQASKAKIIGLATAGGDMINIVKQSAEYKVGQGGQHLAGLLVFIADIHSLGLQTAQGLMLTSAFYWDLNDETRAWSKRFATRYAKVPTMIHAGTYGAVTHYLKAIAAAGTDEAKAVAAKMKAMPVNDFMTKKGVIRADGRLVRDMYLFQVKAPSESRGGFDYYKLVSTIPGEQAFRPLGEGGCPLAKN
ncbi:MAG TPA: ABC transporter substrate-binding protein [Burkholderiales bacterium]|jgi:branched-chain amino acid transport system substrate-binding protein|nr:ABC transporter substrate-binding protein [Burkholderiales bacterium]